MGQTPNLPHHPQDYQIIQQLATGSIVKHLKTTQLHFLKQYSFTSQQDYQNALNSYSLKLSNKNQHTLNFLHFTTKSQNTFCSSFHKIVLIFQYAELTLEDQIRNRKKQKQSFLQKDVWSILCSCILGCVHIVQTEGKMHSGLTSREIRLNNNGCVKLLNPEMIGVENQTGQGRPLDLALTMLQCINMQKCTNADTGYLQQNIGMLSISKDMKQVLKLMVKPGVGFIELEQYLFKLVQDEDSSNASNTPVLKGYTPKLKQKNSFFLKQQIQKTMTECSSADQQDPISYLFRFMQAEFEIQNPDETEQDLTNHDNSPQNKIETIKEVGAFYLKGINGNSKEIQTQQKIHDEKEEQKSSKGWQIGGLQSSRCRNKDSKLEILSDIGLSFKYTYNPSLYASAAFLPPAQLNSTYSLPNLTTQIQSLPSKPNETQTTLKSNNMAPSLDTFSTFQPDSNLYTDPKLFSLIKNDLQEIQKRRSIGDQITYHSKQSEDKLVITHKIDQYEQNYKIIPEKSCKVQDNRTNNISELSQYEMKTVHSYELETNKSNTSIKILNDNKSKSKTNKDFIYNHDQSIPVKNITQAQPSSSLKPLNEINQNRQNSRKAENILHDDGTGFKKNNKATTTDIQKPQIKQNIIVDRNIIAKSDKNQKNDYENNSLEGTAVIANNSHRLSTSSRNHYTNQSRQKIDEEYVHVSQKYTRGNYEGTKLNGKRHGFGTFHYSEGGKYVGNWKQNKMHGKGTLYYPSQKIAYEGNWENDQLSGYGVLYNQQVTNLRSPFDYRDWTEVEEFWVKYEGNFKQDNKQGSGKLFLVNGERFEGQFKDDRIEGQGVLYRGDGSNVKGKWKQNKLIKLF